MLLSALFQIITLLPPAVETEPLPVVGDYQSAVVQLATQAAWSDAALQALPCDSALRQQLLIPLVDRGSDAEVRLAALLAAGVPGDSPLGIALWRRAAQDFDETRVLACLLAPKTVPADALPSLAWIASDPGRSMPQRATACARLLDANVLLAWPLADALLRTGTASDRAEGLADWPRGGRYELPKRILLLSIQDLLRRHQLPATDFEPNAAWAAQEASLVALNHAIQGIEGSPPLIDASSRPWTALHLQRERGQPIAIRALRLLQP
ncbi:MAG: hypothetical protein ACPG31_04615 [Planctomycetota bacterium]